MLTSESRQTDFPSLADRAYLNTAAEGIPPRAVLDALARYGEDRLLGMDGRLKHEVVYEQAKSAVAQAYGLSAAEIGICSCTSEAYNLAALALHLEPGDEEIINDLDFPSGATAWLQPSCAAEARVWRAREGALRVEDLVQLLSPRTRFVTTSLVSFYNGSAVPLPAVLEAVRAHSPGLLAVDVTQALGRIPLDLAGVDLIVSSTHKWILGSHGGGLVGVPRARTEEWTVPAGGWFNLREPFRDREFEAVDSLSGAASFSVGMPNYGAVYAALAGLDYVQGVGIAAIDAHCKPLVAACLEGLKELPVELLTPDEPEAIAGILSIRHPQSDRILHELHKRNIHIMGHAGRLRIAIHGYNTMDDVERLLRQLRGILDRL